MTDDDLDVEGVNYERVDPMRTWRLTAGAEAEAKGAGEDPRERGRPARLRLDLTFESLIPPIGTDGLGRTDRSGDTAAATARAWARVTSSRPAAGPGPSPATTRRSLQPGTARATRTDIVGPGAGAGRRCGGGSHQHRRRHPLRGIHRDPAGDLHRGWVAGRQGPPRSAPGT